MTPSDTQPMASTQPTTDATPSDWTQRSRYSQLTGFKRDILWAIAGLEDGEPYGLGIKAELEDRYGEEINHGRLYPNLDDLVDAGLLEKSSLDRRTNAYELTDRAAAMLRSVHNGRGEVFGDG